MPAARARSALASLRPDKRVRTSAPLSCSRLPTPAPMLPCAMIATTTPMPDLIRKISVARSLRAGGLARNAADAHPPGVRSGMASEPRTIKPRTIKHEQSDPAQASFGDADPIPQGRREDRLPDGLYRVGGAAPRCACRSAAGRRLSGDDG